MEKDSRKGALIEYTREQLWAVYLEIGEAERHFNTVQERYRLISSSWLLATVAGAGYLIVKQKSFGFAPIEIMVSSLAYFGSIGISLLWLLDIKVYQVLLSSYYAEGIALEREQPWLPPIRRRIRSRFKGQLPRLVSVFYIGSTSFLFLFGTAALGTFVYRSWAKGGLFEIESVLASTLAILDALVVAWIFIDSKQADFTLEEDSAEFSEKTRTSHYGQAVIVPRTDPEKAVRQTNEST